VTIAAITNSDIPATGIVDALAHEALATAPATTLGRCDTDIAVRSADGSVRLVTTDAGFDGFPSWSSDGRRLVWSGLRGGQQDLFVADADGSDPVPLTDDSARDFFPRWSPDGSSIAFTSDRDGDLDLYLVAPDGTDIRQLTTGDGDEWLPAWSPDGTRVAYVSDREGQQIRVMGTDGNHDRAVTSNPGRATWPAWSPDGRRIAYESGGVIFIVPVGGGDPVRLPVPQIRVSMHPAWAPGADIAFSADGDLYATADDGTDLRRLTATSTIEEVPVWSPDGTSVAYQISHWVEASSPDPSPPGDSAAD